MYHGSSIYDSFPGASQSGTGSQNIADNLCAGLGFGSQDTGVSPSGSANGEDFHATRNSHLKKLVEDYPEYPIEQQNGQSIFGPPSDLANISIPRGCEVFIGSLPRDVYEDELVPLFSRIGRIYQLRLMMDFSSLNRGYGFVSYTSPGDAQRAIEQIDGYRIRPGRPIGVVPSFDNCKLFLKSIPPHVTEDMLKQAIVDSVKGVVSVEMKNNRTGVGNRCAILEFKTHRDAAMARRTLLPGQHEIIPGAKINVDWAQPPGRNNRNYHRNMAVQQMHQPQPQSRFNFRSGPFSQTPVIGDMGMCANFMDSGASGAYTGSGYDMALAAGGAGLPPYSPYANVPVNSPVGFRNFRNSPTNGFGQENRSLRTFNY